MEQVLFSIPLQRLEPILKNWFKEAYQEVEAQKASLQKSDDNQRFLTAQKFCRRTDTALQSFYNKAPKGEVPGATKFGRKWFVDMDIFEKHLRDNAVPAPA